MKIRHLGDKKLSQNVHSWRTKTFFHFCMFLHGCHVRRTSHTRQWHILDCGVHSIKTSLGQLIVKQITSPVNCRSIFLQETWIGSAVMWNLILKSCSCTLFMVTECSCKFTADRKEGRPILDCFFLHQTPHCRGNSSSLVNLSISTSLQYPR